jgi:branched-chain amino acid transport system ATP-binding protein
MFLEVKGLNAFYGLSHVLQAISLTVERGEIVGLLGRNGMGKSTTLKSIMGLIRSKSGEVVFQGKNIAKLPPHRVAQAGIGYVPEERRVFSNLSVGDNLEIGSFVARKQGRGDGYQQDLDRVFDLFPVLKTRAKQRAGTLSGGEQQMLAIARAMMGHPEVLLMDEPTEGLAPLLVAEVRNSLARINEAGTTILLVEHNIKVALSLTHRVYLMGKGFVGFQGTVAELNAHPEVRAKFLEV